MKLLFLKCNVGACYLHKQPAEAFLPQGLPLCKLKQAPAEVVAEVVEVRVHGIGPAPEIQVVREVDGLLILESFGHLHDGFVSAQQLQQSMASCKQCKSVKLQPMDGCLLGVQHCSSQMQ